MSLRRAWAWTLGALVVAMGGRALLGPQLGNTLPFMLALPAVAVVAWRAGSWAGIALALACVAWLAIPALPPSDEPAEVLRQALLFLPTALVLAPLCGAFSARGIEGSGHVGLDASGERTLRWLRLVMIAALVVPLGLLLIVGSYLYGQEFRNTELRMARIARIAEEHALKVLETNRLLLNQVGALAGNDSDEQILQREAELQARLLPMVNGLPQVQAVWLLDAAGRPLLSSRFMPAPRTIDGSDRDYFQWHRDGRGGLFITEALVGRLTSEPFFNISRRRERADGTFAGVISVSLYSRYFDDFYRELAAEEPGLAITLMRDDGRLIARWPAVPLPGQRQPQDSALMQAIAARPGDGHFEGRSALDGVERLWSYRHMKEFPVYLVAAVDRRTVVDRWADPVAVLAAFIFPIAIALALIAWFAMRRTREELAMLDQLEHEQLHRQRVEDALRQSQKLEAVGRLTGGVAHDINNLLMVVGNNLYLHKRMLPQAAGSPQLGAIERAVAAGAKLTRQLLSFSRRQALHTEVIRLQDRLPGLMDLVRPVLGAGIALDAHVAEHTAAIEVDAAELELGLINLAVNARDAMPGGGRLSVHADNAAEPPPGLAGAFVRISVADDGTGIDPALLDRVFEPFFTTKPVGQGTGLGLSQVYGLCTRAGGTVTVHSEPGVGTRFDLFFPAMPASAAGAAAAEQDGAQDTLDCSVLLVEDNSEVAQATLPLIESLGCRVRRVDSADAAQELLRAAGAPAVDVVLSDIAMPGALDGIALARWLKTEHPALPVVLMTGYASKLEQALQQEFEVLQKPVAPQALARALREALQR